LQYSHFDRIELITVVPDAENSAMTIRWLLASMVVLATLLFPTRAVNGQVEDVNMNTLVVVEGGHIVAKWSTGGFDHYNIRWNAHGGPYAQIHRDGDKRFVYITPYQPNVVYSVAVQACNKPTFGRSQCTSWDEVSCGQVRNPCTGPRPRSITINGNSGFCLDVHAPDQRTNGGRVQVWQCNGSDQQLWTVRGKEIVSLAGKCLDVHAPDLRTNGGRVQVWDCNGTVQQRWRKVGNTLVNDGGKCLDAHAPDMRRNGGRVQVWDCNGTPQQRFSQGYTF
jgi:hypothetical protein